LELFAGTGAFSLECLSRGAEAALCVERASRHAAVLKENLRLAELDPARLKLRVQDAFAALGQLAAAQQQFDLIFADPPYGEKNTGRRSVSYAQKLIDDPRLPSLMAPSGRFVLGHAKRDVVSLVNPWEEVRCLKHGDSIMRFLRVG
jgi:16S rRNA (guanine(966)-N(2))-methyltransferase RsmD